MKTNQAKIQVLLSRTFMAATVVAAGLLTASCEKENNIVNSNSSVEILATVSHGTTTKTGTSTAYKPVDGKQLFLFYTGVENTADKEKTSFTYATAANTWTTTKAIFWDDLKLTAANNYKFFAVAPSVPVTTPEVTATQTLLADYVASDQLVAYTEVAETNLVLPLTFKHVLSQVVVNLTTSDKEEDGTVVDGVELSTAKLQIAGVNRAYTLAYTDPTSAIPAVATVKEPAVTPLAVLMPYEVPFTEGDATKKFMAVLSTQVFEANTLILTFTVSGKEYTWKNGIAITTEAGKNTNIALHVTKTEIELAADGIQLTGWVDNAAITGGVQL